MSTRRTARDSGVRAASRYAKTTRLVVSADQAYIASVTVALDANRIPHIDQPIGTPWMTETAVEVRELDIRRAREAIEGLQRTTSSPTTRPIRALTALLLLLLLVVIAIGVVAFVGDLFHG